MVDTIVCLENDEQEINELIVIKGAKTLEDVEKTLQKNDIEIDLDDSPLIMSVENSSGFCAIKSFADVDVTEFKME